MKNLLLAFGISLWATHALPAQNPPENSTLAHRSVQMTSPDDFSDPEIVLLSPEEAPCDFNTLQCGQTLTNQTNSGFGNDFVLANYSCYTANSDPFTAPDHQYRIVIGAKTSVHFVLDITTPGIDLGIFLLSSCSPAVCIAYSDEIQTGTSPTREVLDVNLGPGTYYLVVDGYTTNQIGNYSISANCNCSCIEAPSDQPAGEKLYCDNFGDYLINAALDPQSTRWRRWSNASTDATVISAAGNSYARFQQVGAAKPDMLYVLNDKTTGRYRVSWKMLVPAGKKGYFNVLHQLPNASSGSGAQWAFEVFFNGDGTGYFELNNSGTIITQNFLYPSGVWFNVVNIFQLSGGLINAKSASLFINNDYVYTWDFTLGSAGSPNKLAAVNFYADTGYDFYVDDICVWAKTGTCNSSFNEAYCIKNGELYNDETSARCNLYTSREWWPCYTVCDYGGSFIYRGDIVSGLFEPTDLNFNLPLNTGFESCDPGPLIVGDVYIFHKNDNLDVNIANFTSSSNLSKYYTFTCKSNTCQFFKTCITGYENDPLNIPCNNFYYIVVIGPVGATYSFNIAPNGPCPPNPEVLSCGASDTDVTGVNNLNSGNSAYAQCYSGSRTYSGGEKIYKFTLASPSQVTISLNSTNPSMGLFLFSFLCGKNCIGYAENSITNANAVISTVLNDGTYYIAVDKATAGTANFSIQLQCDPFATFYNYSAVSNINSCPLHPTDKHTVRIPSSAYDFSIKDQIQFVFWDTDNTVKGTDSLTRNWSGGPYMDFVIKKDVPNDGEKCSYAAGDTFIIYLVQRENGKRVRRKLIPTYLPPNGSPGQNATNTFTVGGGSVVSSFEEQPVVTFGAQTLSIKPPSTASSSVLPFSTNLPWQLEINPANATWLSSNKMASDGAEDITLTFQNHSGELPRTAILRFYAIQYPNIYQEHVTVEQQGVCNTNPALSISASAATLCAGGSSTLTANVVPPTLYNYLWSNGATTPSITVTPSVSTTYSVTITHKYGYCTASKSATRQITVNTRPIAPVNLGNQVVCQDAANPQLSVSTPNDVTADWYTMAAGGSPFLSNSLSYTPDVTAPNTYTYFVEARNTLTGCTSVDRSAVTLTIHPKPALTAGAPQCAPNLQTYSVGFSTDGNSYTATAGTISGSGGNYTLSGVPKNTNVTITATNANNCSRQVTVTSPSCPCPVLAPPVSAGDRVICMGQSIPSLSVSVAQGQTADWYTSGGASLAQGTLTYTPSAAGVYFAESRDTLTNCVSTNRTPVSLTINALPSITVNAKTCTLPLSTNLYSVSVQLSIGSVLTASDGQVSGSNGSYLVVNIPTSQTLTLTATDTLTGCISQLNVEAPDCMCPVVDPPVSEGNEVICAGSSVPPLTVSVGMGETADWYTNAGALLLAGSTSYTPSAAGVYFAESRNTSTGCKSAVRTPVMLTIHPLPQLSIADPVCAANLLSYSIAVSTTGTQLTSTAGVVSGSGGMYTVDNIAKGLNISVTSVIDSTTCMISQPVTAPPCPCPSVNAPVSGGNQVICQGQIIPALSVVVGPDETADWYSSTGVKLDSNKISFLPPSAGTYLAEARSTINQCRSAVRTPVSLTINPLPTLSSTVKTCAPNLLTYSVTVTGPVGVSVTASSGTVAANGSAYTVSGITSGVDVVVTALNTATGCLFQLSENALVCTCPPVDPPASGGDMAYCEGSAIPALTVSVDENETANWYDVFGALVAGETLFYTPTQPGTYWVESKNVVNNCISSTKTPVVLTENPRPNLILLDTLCTPDREFYFATVSTDASTPQVTPAYPVVPNGGGQFTIVNIPVGTGITITSKFNATNCQSQLSVAKAECPCPTVNPPISGGDVRICAGTLPYPELTVTTGAGETADWYLQPSFGTPLPNGINTTKFAPTTPGTYFAQARHVLSQCISAGRTPVRLIEDEQPVVSAGADKSICAGESINLSGASISDSVGGQWLASVPGGQFEPDNGYLTAQKYTPPPTAPFVLLTLQSNDPDGPCAGVSDQMELKINPLPTLSVDTVFCAPDLQFYTVRFHSNGTPAIDAGNLTQTGAQTYVVSGIPHGSDLTISSFITMTGCSRQIVVPKPDCQCPFVAQPVSLGDRFACPEESFPTLIVSVDAGQSANWYDVNGQPVGVPNSLNLVPPAPGVYYAETVELVSGCVSSVRTPVAFIQYQSPLADAGPDRSVCEGIPALLTAQTLNVSYHWSTGDTTQNISVLPPQDSVYYYLTVTSTEGCSAMDATLVRLFPAPSAQASQVTPVKCFGDLNGVLSVAAAGGTPPYKVLWSNGAMTNQNAGLPAGFYSVTITDQLGCQASDTSVLEQPPLLEILQDTVTNTPAGTFNGSVEILVAGGILPYKYQWAENNIILPGDTAILSGLGVGAYFVTVTDDHGCAVFGGPYDVKSTIAANEADWNKYISVFPNPTAGRLFLRFTLPEASDVRLYLYDEVGKELMFRQYAGIRENVVELDLADFASGLYLLNLNLNHGNVGWKISLQKN